MADDIGLSAGFGGREVGDRGEEGDGQPLSSEEKRNRRLPTLLPELRGEGREGELTGCSFWVRPPENRLIMFFVLDCLSIVSMGFVWLDDSLLDVSDLSDDRRFKALLTVFCCGREPRLGDVGGLFCF